MSAQENKKIFTLPPGRLVWGSVYKEQITNQDGTPIIVKKGPNQGKPGRKWSFGVAIAKPHPQALWWDQPWGQQFMAVAQAGFPQATWQHRDFSWKIQDGDSAELNTKGRAPNAIEHNRGHWIIACTTYLQAPPVYMAAPGTKDFKQVIDQPGLIKCGYFVEVNIEVEDNGSAQTAGLYVSPRMVAFAGYGPEIQQGPDVNEAGFGQAPLPQGAQNAPVGGFNPMATPGGMPGQQPGMMQPGVGPVAGAPHIPGMPQQQPQQQYQPPGGQQMPGQQPQYQQPGGMPNMMPGQQQPLRRVMTAAANGATYEQFLAANFTDEMMIARGVMIYQ